MNKNLELVCQSLDALSLAVSGGSAEERLFTEVYGWNCPAVTKNDLALIPKRLASRIREASPENIDEDLATFVNDYLDGYKFYRQLRSHIFLMVMPLMQYLPT